MATQGKIYLGLMSGTSLDGVDIAAVDFSKGTLSLLAADTLSYDDHTAEWLQQAVQQAHNLPAHQVAELDSHLGHVYGQRLKGFMQQQSIASTDIAAIGSHGHTLLHQPASEQTTGYSLQIGDPNIIAAHTACTVVADFRRADIALGGQGAPLAPAFHGAFLASENAARVVVNIGGIANVSLLDGFNISSGFDTGPGNTLMDAYCQKHLGIAYDKHGELAKQGCVHEELYQAIMQDPYFSLTAPKSTGREYFHLDWLEQYQQSLNIEISHNDMLATLCQVTIQSIANDCLQYQANISHVYVCGGGSHNHTLMQGLSQALSCPVDSTEVLGMNPDYVEAMAFAWLAKQRMNHQTANIPAVTGASRTCLLGGIYSA